MTDGPIEYPRVMAPERVWRKRPAESLAADLVARAGGLEAATAFANWTPYRVERDEDEEREWFH